MDAMASRPTEVLSLAACKGYLAFAMYLELRPLELRLGSSLEELFLAGNCRSPCCRIQRRTVLTTGMHIVLQASPHTFLSLRFPCRCLWILCWR